MKLDLKSMTERQLLVLTVVGVCVLTGALGGGIYLGFARLAATQNEVASLQTQLDQVAGRVAQIRALMKELQELQATGKDYERILPDHANKEELLELFSEMKNETGVRISSVKVNELEEPRATGKSAKSAKPPMFRKVEFELSVEGDFFQFGRFVNLLENYPRFMAVSDLAFREPDENQVHTISLSGCTYKYVRPPAAAKPSKSSSGRALAQGKVK